MANKIVEFLKIYEQQQSFEVIRDAFADLDPDAEPITRDDLDKLVKAGHLEEVDGGVDSRGESQTHYVAAD